MHKRVKFLLLASAVCLLLPIGFLAYVSWELRTQPPTSMLPELVRNLPGPLVADIKKAFSARVRARFTDGIQAQGLASELQREGFELRHTRQDIVGSPNRYFAFVEQHGGMCVTNWSIWWRRDAQGRAQDIDGRLDYSCP